MTQGATKGLLCGPNLFTSQNNSSATLLYFFGKSLRWLLVYATILFNHCGAIFLPLNYIFQFLYEAYCQHWHVYVVTFFFFFFFWFTYFNYAFYFKCIVLWHHLLIVQLSLCSSLLCSVQQPWSAVEECHKQGKQKKALKTQRCIADSSVLFNYMLFDK